MRKEAEEILRQVEAGKPIKSIRGNAGTRQKVHKMWLYRQIIDMLLSDIQSGKYRLNLNQTKAFYERLRGV